MKKMLCCVVLCSSLVIGCCSDDLENKKSEQSSNKDEHMIISEPKTVKIKQCKDIKPFAGKMVAVTSDSFRVTLDAYHRKLTIFGYMAPELRNWSSIPNDSNEAYTFYQLKKPSKHSLRCTLSNEKRNKGEVQIREATNLEIAKLRSSISAGILSFSDFDFPSEKEKVEAILNANGGCNIKPAKK